MKTWSGERGARILLVESQVVLPAFSRPGRGARHDSERTQMLCKEAKLKPGHCGLARENVCHAPRYSLLRMQRICC